MPKDPSYFPHANQAIHPKNRFFIDGRWLNLYTVDDRTPSTSFSLYWQNEINPVQHAMTAFEVFSVLADLLKPLQQFVHFVVFPQKYATRMGWVCLVTPGCHKFSMILALTAKDVAQINGAGHILVPGTLAIDEKAAAYILYRSIGVTICEDCRKSLTP